MCCSTCLFLSPGRTRTGDRSLARRVLYPLSYRGMMPRQNTRRFNRQPNTLTCLTVVGRRWDDGRMDAGLAAFLGAIAGAAIAGVPPVIAAFVQRSTAKAQREHEKGEKDAQREHERLLRERAEKVDQIREWRDGLAEAHRRYSEYEFLQNSYRGRSTLPPRANVLKPNIVGEAWFQSLRQHLPEFSGMAGSDEPAFYSDGAHIECDSEAAEVLAREISRIEHEWLGER